MQDPCGRLPAPDSYAGSAAPSIAGVGGHPTRFSPTQDVASDIDDSYGLSRDSYDISGPISEFGKGMARRVVCWIADKTGKVHSDEGKLL